MHDALYFPTDEARIPEYFLAIEIHEDGSFSEVYNGSGRRVWQAIQEKNWKPDNTRNVMCSKKMLRELNKEVDPTEQIVLKPNCHKDDQGKVKID